ncbi:FHA domain-containing protein FhaB/FipA [Microbacterium album]|uniref:FHA domain-containing protein n=1 Tax=Microbacterium album TaxID=2053191 RepID=A0A917IGP6_9MICO|nr:FHA domain-containing protein [Microbacterium album]GGH44554.1 FHA domain-containing protein [Microbacterium album]
MSESELTLLILQVGFLLLMWLFVFAVVFALRSDVFGVRVRKLPETASARPSKRPSPPAAPAAAPAPRAAAASPSSPATTATASRIVITSGPKAGLELPLGTDTLTIGRSSEAGLVIRDDYTSSQHARLVLRGDQWMLQDLDSTNGTFHDGQRVASSSPVAVRVGAPIKVGATTFELRK